MAPVARILTNRKSHCSTFGSMLDTFYRVFDADNYLQCLLKVDAMRKLHDEHLKSSPECFSFSRAFQSYFYCFAFENLPFFATHRAWENLKGGVNLCVTIN